MNDMYVGKLPKALKASCMVTMDFVVTVMRNVKNNICCIIGQQTNVDWNALVSLVLNETNTDVRMYTWRIYF